MLKLVTQIAAARRFSRNENGATAIEYGLIAGLIAVVIILAVTAAGDSLFEMFNEITEGLGGTPAS